MIKQKIQSDRLAALKSKEQEKLTTLRFILSKIINKEIDTHKELSDEETIDVLKKVAKELHESIDAFTKGNRPDLLNQAKIQLEVVTSYLPAELSDDQLKKEVERIVAANRPLFEKNPKAIIGLCMKELKNKADSSRVIKTLNSLQ